MPSPFPGMDPYLVDPFLWPGVHHGLISAARAQLNASLPPGYVADTGERVYGLDPRRSLYPDALVLQSSWRRERPSAQSPAGSGTVMLDEEPPWVIDLPPVEIREPFIRILSLRESEQVVAIVEILSPSNKAPGGEGRELYLRKQEEVLDSPVHLLEIDLLRTGEHTIAAPRRAMEGRGRWDYLVCLHRGDERGRYRVWPVRLRERLPSVPAPLLPGDPECPLDLQAVFERWYDEGAYARRIDYSAPPAVALRPKDRAWASALTQPPAG